MEKKQMKMKIQNKYEGIDQILKHVNSNNNKYLTSKLLSKEYEHFYVTNDFKKYCKHKFPETVLKIPIQNNIIEITQPPHIDNTCIIPVAKIQNIVLYKKDIVNEIILFLPYIKDSPKNLSSCHQKNIYLPKTGTKDSSLALLQYFPGQCCHYKHNQNVYHEYCCIDLNQMSSFVVLMYKMIKYLLQNIESNHLSLSDSYTLLIYLENIIQYLIYYKQRPNNIIKYEKCNIKPSYNCVQYEPIKNIYTKNVHIMKPITTSNIFLSISTKQQNMQLNILIFKYNTFFSGIFKDLAYKTIYTKYEPKNTVSLCIKNWHIQNIAFGYLLCKLLNHFNVSTLYLMRNLYFVIIKSTTLNLGIDINFKIKNGILLVYDTNPYGYFKKPINWNINSSILKRLSLVNTTIYMLQKCSQLQQLELKVHTKPSSSNLHILKTLKNDIPLRLIASDSINHGCSNFDFEYLISLKTKMRSFSKSDKESEETVSLKEIGQENMVIYAEEAAGHTLFNNKIDLNTGMYDLPFLKRGALFTNLCKQSKEIKTKFNMLFMDFYYINEIIFERFTAYEYWDVANQYWVHISSQTSCKPFLKCLGQSLVNIFFGATL